jgi:multidrug transporter EmrE-like cation transporter
MNNGLVFALIGVALNTAAQLFLKATTNRVGEISLAKPIAATALSIGSVPAFYAGMACYAVSIIVWLVALSRLPVSVAYPLLSIGYVFNAVLAYTLFDESLSVQKLVGIGFIILGVVIVARST